MQTSLKVKARAGVATPVTGQIDNHHAHNTEVCRDRQVILRDGLWEICSILTACGVSAMAAAGGGSIEAIETDLRSARLALREAITTFQELRALGGGDATQ